MSVPGYPPHYGLGIEMIIWLINIIFASIITVISFLKIYKTSLVNRRELFFGNGIFFLAVTIYWLTLEMGFLIPDLYSLMPKIGGVVINSALLIFIYFWQKHLIKIKYNLPILITLVTLIIAIIQILSFLIFSIDHLIFSIFLIFGGVSSSIFLYILILRFIRKVIGKLRIYGISLLLGLLSYQSALIFMQPIYSIVPGFLSFLASTLMFFCIPLYVYGMFGIIDGLTSFYNQARICTIHRGKISEGTHIYYCPNCTTTYCQKCFEQIIKNEGCWNCQEHYETEEDINWELEKPTKNGMKI